MKVPELVRSHLLKVALKRVAPANIPRSGEAGAAMDCYLLRLFLPRGRIDQLAPAAGGAPLVVLGRAGRTLECLAYDGDMYTTRLSVDISILDEAEAEITHYRGLWNFVFNGWGEFALHHFLRIDYAHARWISIRDTLTQGLYARRDLPAADRYRVLRAVLDLQLAGRDEITCSRVMTALHSQSWYVHPQGQAQRERVEFFLDALTDTQELSLHRGVGAPTYQVTGQGVASLTSFDEQERKHTETNRTQRQMFWLTLLVVVLTAIQAGLIKLPPIWDFGAPVPAQPPAECSTVISS